MDGKYNNEEVIRGEIPFFVAYFDRVLDKIYVIEYT